MSTHLYHAIAIGLPVAAVFDYATTPAHWPQWHPSSLELYGDTAHALAAGSVFEEDVRAGGRRGHLRWTVVECAAPRLWVAQASMDNAVSLTLTYRVSPRGDAALFERELTYSLPDAWLRLLNVLFLRRRIEAESRQSLAQLKSRLESKWRAACARQA